MTLLRTLLLAVCTALAGCGQTGPLYPQPEPDELAGDAPAPAATPAT